MTVHKNRLHAIPAVMHAHQAGGMEELQTDVMRFMAILAFCLVAIFALVQSIPLSPAHIEAQAEKSEVVSGPETPDTLPSVAPDPGSPPDKASPLHSGPDFSVPLPDSPAMEPKLEPKRDIVKPDLASVTRFAYRNPAPLESIIVDAPVATRSQLSAKQPQPKKADSTPATERTSEPEKGFTLKFASAAALRELVENNQVSFFALTKSQSWRLGEQRGQLHFKSATRPRQMHEMLPATVPTEVLSALNRAGVSQSRESVRWGVVLTEITSRQLQQIMRSHQGGALTILNNGTVKLEPAGGITSPRGGPA